MWAFREFQKDKDDVKLYLHMGTTDAGVDIIELALRYGYPNKLIITGNTPGIPSVSKERLNLIYNCADVGLNTSEGEGWGLVNWEHAATRTPQIVPYNASTPNVWEPGTAMFIIAKIPKMHPAINTVGRSPSLEHTIELLNTAYNDWKFNSSKGLDKIAESAYQMVTEEKYSWKSIANSFDEVFTEVLNDNNSVA
jgi:glycosyltransferase involved in cell wall biosynthesis